MESSGPHVSESNQGTNRPRNNPQRGKKGKQIAKPAQPQGYTRILCSSLSEDANNDDIREIFEKHGNVKSVNLARDTQGKSKWSAIITFSTHQGATAALAEDGQEHMGCVISVSYNLSPGARNQANNAPGSEESKGPKPQHSAAKNDYELFCQQLSKRANEEDIRKLFEKYGNVIVRLNSNEETAFVKFSTPAEAALGLAEHGKMFKGRKLVVEYSNKSPPGQGKSTEPVAKAKAAVPIKPKTQPKDLEQNSELCIRQLSSDATKQDLINIFSQFGTIEEVKLRQQNRKIAAQPQTDLTKDPTTTGIYRLPLSFLRTEHRTNQNMLAAISFLEQGFTHFRKARIDGNCYYRSVAVSYIESLIRNALLKQLIQGLYERQPQFAYLLRCQPAIFESLYLKLVEMYDNAKHWNQVMMRFNQALQQPDFDQSLWMLARYMTASFLQNNYLLDLEIASQTHLSYEELMQQILTPGIEAQSVMLRLTASAFMSTINTCVLQQDSGQWMVTKYTPFGGRTSMHQISLLQKPGSYDLLYTSDNIAKDAYVFETASFGEYQYADPPIVPQIEAEGSGFAFVKFSRPEEAAAGRAVNGQEYMGRKLKVNYRTLKSTKKQILVDQDDDENKNQVEESKEPKPSSGPVQQNCEVCCKNLSRDATQQDISYLFEQYGNVIDVRPHIKKGKFTGIALVKFSTPEEAANGLSANGQVYREQKIYVEYSSNKSAPKQSNPDGKAEESKTPRPQPRSVEKNCEIFCKQLSWNATKDDIFNLFAQYGSVINVKPDETKGKFNGMAFVKFATPEEAAAGLSANGMEHMGRQIKVEPCHKSNQVKAKPVNKKKSGEETKKPQPQPGVVEQNCELCCKQLSQEANEADISNLFEDFGQVIAVHLLRTEAGKSKGTAFIKFSNPEEAARGLTANGQEFLGRKLRVQYKTNKTPPSAASVISSVSSKATTSLRELCCKQLSREANEDDVKNLFAEHGKVVQWRLLRTTQGVSKWVAFVKFLKPEQAAAGLGVNGVEHMGRVLSVEYKNNKTSQQPASSHMSVASSKASKITNKKAGVYRYQFIIKNLSTDVPELSLWKQLGERFGCVDFELDLRKHPTQKDVNLGSAFFNTNNAAIADSIKQLDKTKFIGRNKLSVIPKRRNKRDKYIIQIEGLNTNHPETTIEGNIKSKFHLTSLNFILNYADPPKNTISRGNGVIYTSDDKFSEEIKTLDGQKFLGKVINVIVKETASADSPMKKPDLQDRVPDKYAIQLKGIDKSHSKQMIEDEIMIMFGLDTLKFRLNFTDFPINKNSMGSGIIYTSDDQLAESLGNLDGSNFMGQELTVLVKETNAVAQQMSQEENKIYVKSAMEKIQQFTLPGLLIIKNIDRKALQSKDDLQQALKEKIGDFKIKVNFINSKLARFAYCTCYDIKGIKNLLKLHHTVWFGKLVYVELNSRKYGTVNHTLPTQLELIRAASSAEACAICNKDLLTYSLNLPCSHRICGNLRCLASYSNEVGRGNITAVTCKVCEIPIPEEIIANSLGGDDQLYELKNSFICNICFQEATPNQSERLEWGHRYHMHCLLKHIVFIIDDWQTSISDLLCPEPTCNIPVQENDIYRLCDSEKSNKYARRIVAAWEINDPGWWKVVCQCGYVWLAPEQEPFARCPLRECTIGLPIHQLCKQQHERSYDCSSQNKPN